MIRVAGARHRVPAWVPDGLEGEYVEVMRRHGEEEAARHCRRLKRAMEGTPGAPPSRRPVASGGGSAPVAAQLPRTGAGQSS